MVLLPPRGSFGCNGCCLEGDQARRVQAIHPLRSRSGKTSGKGAERGKHPLEGSDHDVRKLEVDSRNNKWFATETGGVKVLLNDNSWLNGNEGFTVDNSPLLSNSIESIAFNPKNGDAFIATLKGISILRTEYSEPLLTLEKVKTYPSPFIIPANSDLVIDG